MPTPEVFFGAMISTIGIGLICFHVRSHRGHLADEKLSEPDHRFYQHQYFRRLQTSTLAVTLGALIGLCGYLKAFEESPIFATTYVIGLLLLALWLVLLAISDAMASRVYASQLRRRNLAPQKSLKETLAEVRQAHGLDPNN
jgi:multisubunit Na+/H+ antiporter MnhG subunit